MYNFNTLFFMRKDLTLFLGVFLALLLGISTNVSAQRVRPDRQELLRKAGGNDVQNLLDRANQDLRKHSRVRPFMPTTEAPAGMPVRKAPRLAETASDIPVIWGNVVAGTVPRDPYTGNYAYGVYQITLSDGTLSVDSIHTGSNMRASGGGCFVGDVYHMIEYTSFYGFTFMTYYKFNSNTWQQLNDEYGDDVEDYSTLAVDQTYDITTGNIYGFFYTSDQEKVEFGIMDYAGLTRSTISEDTVGALTISADKSGQLYSIADDGNLYKVDKTTGTFTLVGATGFTPGNYTQSATFDLKNNKIYWAACLSDYTSHLICVDPATGKGTDLGSFPGNQEIVTLYIPAPTAMAAPDHVSDVSISFPNGSTTGTVSFTMPTTTYEGTTLTGDLTYNIDVDGEQAATGTAAPGANVTTTITVEKNGVATFNITASNGAGTSVATNDKLFIGLDEPQDIANVNLTIDGFHARLTWDAPSTIGSYGGYVDPDSLSYYVIRMPGEIVVDTVATTSFEEDLPEGSYKSYFYAVTPTNGSHMGYSTFSNHVVCGHAYTIPYDEQMEDSTVLDLYKAIDANGDGHTWDYYGTYSSRYSSRGIRYYTNWSDRVTPADDWLVSPGINLEAGKAYKAVFYTSVADSARYSISYGTGDDVSAYTELQPMTTKAYSISNPKDTITYIIPISEEGEYHIAIHCQSKGDWLYFYLERLNIVEGPSIETPDSVSDIRVIPAAMGALSADIKFVAPSKNIGGTAFGADDDINVEVTRSDNSVVATTTVKAGAETSVTDNNPVNGFNTYTIKASNAAGKGVGNSATAWIGIDTPLPPVNVKAYIEGDATETVHITWDAPEGNVGVHGGYYDPDDLLYKVTDLYNGAQGDSLDGTELLIHDAIVLTMSRQTQVYLNVQAFNAGGISTKAQSNYVWNGKPYDTPFQENFDGTYNGGYYTTYGYPTHTWVSPDRYTRFQTNDGGSADGDGYSYYWAAKYDNNDSIVADGYINSAKISLDSTSSPVLVYNYVALPGYKSKFRVEAFDCVGDTVVLDEVDFASLTGSRGWRSRSVDLSDYKADGNPFLLLSFHAIDYSGTYEATDTIAPICLDNIRVFDRKSSDLVASEFYNQTPVTVGDTATFYVKVANWGESAVNAADYKVSIVNDADSVLAIADGLAIDADWWKYVPVKFPAKVTDRADQTIHGVVVFDADGNTANNATDADDLHISMPAYPVVDDLSATVNTDNSVSLAWTVPDSAAAHAVSEGFESYDASTISNFGLWKLIDGDGGYGYNISGLRLPNLQVPAAYQILNASSIGLRADDYPAYFPHEGDQCAIAKAAIPDYAKNGHNDDWLISPELTGEAQTISLWAKSTGQSYLESFEILYSTTGKDTADFQLLQTNERISADWTEYSAELPEGAKYFAIRCISEDKNFFFVDDVKFLQAALPIVGYNVYDYDSLIATTAGDATTYTDNSGRVGDHHYRVSVVYGFGESALSNAADVTSAVPTGIDAIAGSNHPFDIFTVDGIRVAHNATSLRGLKRGVYIVEGQKYVVK